MADYEYLEHIGMRWGCPHLAPCYKRLAELHQKGHATVQVDGMTFGRIARSYKNSFMRFLQEFAGWGTELAPEEDFARRVKMSADVSIHMPFSFEDAPEYVALDEMELIQARLQSFDHACNAFLSGQNLTEARYAQSHAFA